MGVIKYVLSESAAGQKDQKWLQGSLKPHHWQVQAFLAVGYLQPSQTLALAGLLLEPKRPSLPAHKHQKESSGTAALTSLSTEELHQDRQGYMRHKEYQQSKSCWIRIPARLQQNFSRITLVHRHYV